MAKIKAYMRVAKSSRGYKMEVTSKPTNTPLNDGGYRYPKNLPTVFFTLEFDIDDTEFDPVKATVPIPVKVNPKKKNIFAYEEADAPEFDDNCLPECLPGDHKCGK